MTTHYSSLNKSDNEVKVFKSRQTYGSKAEVVLEYGEGTYKGAIGYADPIADNGLIGFDFTLSEGKGASSCKIDILDPSRSLINLLLEYVDEIGGLLPVLPPGSSPNQSPGNSGTIITEGCWLMPMTGYVSSLHKDAVGGRPGHNGVDIASTKIKGQQIVYATRAGTVIASQWDSGGGGNYVAIDHGGGYISQYLHLHEPSNLKVNDKVKAGATVGLEGNTGRVFGGNEGTHLDFQIKKDGVKINPGLIFKDLNVKQGKVTALTEVCSAEHGASSSESSSGSPSSQDEVVNLLISTALEEGVTNKAQIANILAQVEIETNFKYLEEFASGSAYEGRSDLGNNIAGDGKRFKGRGYIQITGRTNYTKFSNILNVDFISNPDLAKNTQNAAKIAIIGMRDGIFTGKSLGDYINSSGNDFYNARRIVNGTDKANQVVTLSNKWLNVIDDLIARVGGEDIATNPTNSSGSSSSFSSSSNSAYTPNGGLITITVFSQDEGEDLPGKVEYQFIHTGVSYNEIQRTVSIYGQSVAFKLAQKLQNTAYTDITLSQIFSDFAQRTNSSIQMKDDGVVYEYFNINNKSPWRALIDESRRRGYLVSVSPKTPSSDSNTIHVQRPSQLRDEIEQDIEEKGIEATSKIYRLRNNFNAPLDFKIEHQAEHHNDGSSIHAFARQEFDIMGGTIELTEDGKLLGLGDDGYFISGSSIPVLKPIYKNKEVNVTKKEEANTPSTGNESTTLISNEEQEETEKREAVKEVPTVDFKYDKYVRIVESGRSNSVGNPIKNVQVIIDKKIVATFSALSGTSRTQNISRNIAGNAAPSPFGEYTIASSQVPGIPRETGGVFLPYTPNFRTNRSALGYHIDPSWGKSNGRDGTAGCMAFRTLTEYNQFVDLVHSNNITRMIIEDVEDSTSINKITSSSTSSTSSLDAEDRNLISRMNGVSLTCSLPTDNRLILLSPGNFLYTEGFGVDKNRTRRFRRVENRIVTDYLDRLWFISEINHSFSSNGFITTLKAKSPFRGKDI